MSRTERLKEEIGWLKVVFGILVAIDISVLGWAAKNFNKTSVLLLLLGALVVVFTSVTIFMVNRKAYRKIDELEDL